MRGAASRAPTVSVAKFRDDRLYPKIKRVVAAIIEKGKVVTPVDVLTGMGLLKPDDLEAWRRGRIPYRSPISHDHRAWRQHCGGLFQIPMVA